MGKRRAAREWTTAAWTRAYQRILGDELRAARKAKGWTRQDLKNHLGLDLSLQSLATYELGSRQISSMRLTQICFTLEIDVRDLIGRVLERLNADTQRRRWTVDLVAASQLDDPELHPLRRWATCRLNDHGQKVVELDQPTLGELAKLCQMDTARLALRLPRPQLTLAAGDVAETE